MYQKYQIIHERNAIYMNKAQILVLHSKMENMSYF